jgi:glycosyltransferase involved in cell wall biosynthesis
MKSIWVHSLVKNEARWLWYSVTSVIDHVEKILLWDTGSTDGTLKIIEKLRSKYPGKIDFREYGEVTPETFTKARQEMLEATTSDWFIVLDADEVWWENSIKKVMDTIRKDGDKLESIVVPTVNLVGDIYHQQPVSTGKYKIGGRVGHYNLRAVNRKIPGLQALGPHGKMGWADGERVMIQERSQEKIKFIDAPYLHATNLKRAGEDKDKDVIKRKKKLKYEFGISLPKDYYYPEAFFEGRPDFIESPWQVMDTSFKVRAFFETPARKLKRMILPDRVGY